MAGEKLNLVDVVPEKQEGPSFKRISDFIDFIKKELKPRGNIATPFNLISLPIMLLGYVLIVLRLAYGLGQPITNLNQQYPWGLWIGFDVVTGVAFAGGAYVLCFIVYILRVEKYHAIIRATVLNGFLAYLFYAGAIVLDIGRWWNIYNPMIGNDFGVNAVMFLVAWHFFLYMLAELVEFSPAIAEWLGLRRLRKILGIMTLGAVVFGITLSTLHQSGLGALMMMAKSKIHPLWYTEFIPILYFVSSIFAGLSMVIFEGSITHKVFSYQVDASHHEHYNDILVGLARICSVAMFGYFFLKVLLVVHEHAVQYINSPMGYWWLFEVIGFILVPCFLFASGAQQRNMAMIKFAAIITMVGIILNRLNYTFLAYNWYVPLSEKYWPSWIELIITASIILTEVWAFRWMVNRMPVLKAPPAWAVEKEH
ncbi:MAG: NrfD/PsrC family molybdoenzyme membrane anchor subunit [Thermodesulfovibrionales bacterium]|nr:NrfD/PsrC family molybdoenzyme membrane anchor subunit [Thermodesulfovibrionales bacterium]